MPKPTPQVRIEPDLYEAIRALAAKNKRSVAKEIELILETHVTVQEAWPEK